MGWDAALFDRDAKVEVRFEADRADLVVIRIFLGPGDEGSDALGALAEDLTRASGPPGLEADGGLVWRTASATKGLSLEDAEEGREIRLSMAAPSPAD
jgi:hypothetical protein